MRAGGKIREGFLLVKISMYTVSVTNYQHVPIIDISRFTTYELQYYPEQCLDLAEKCHGQ